MTGLGDGGLLVQVDDGGNSHGVTAEDVGQVLTDAAGTAGGDVVTGGMVGVAGVAGAGRGLGGGRLRGAVGAFRARLGPALRDLRLSLGTVLSLVLSLVLGLGTAVGIGHGAIGGVTRGVVDGTVKGVGSPLIRFGHGLLGRLGAAGLLGVLGRGLVPALGREGMHLGLLGGDGHRFEQLGERIGGTRRGEGSRRDRGTGIINAPGLGSGHRFGGHDDLDGAGDRTHVLGLLSGVHAP